MVVMLSAANNLFMADKTNDVHYYPAIYIAGRKKFYELLFIHKAAITYYKTAIDVSLTN